ncbi:hypothetical protein EZS27_021281 [termite gut metagenome]|uniref:Uncharacterized protein n=1 Tax=termite gut metagenome TaxID=433724 RepID=A0A5J4R7J6_9ZZZZ
MAKQEQSTKDQNLDNNDKHNTLRIEIVSNWSLLEILSDRKKVFKIMTALLVIVFTIFIGLAFVTISIKRIYPYNDIKINAFGATTMQNENVEIIYWLFNTADLWANSGIRVDKGDILTVRASGKSHTAIHHLVQDVEKNNELRDKWLGTDGDRKNTTKRDSLRAQYRIFANRAQDALLMQVVPEKIDRNSKDFNEYLLFDEPGNKTHEENYFFIGKERVDLRIHNAGILHFAVNDIVLTDTIIKKMIAENNLLINKEKEINKNKNLPDTTWTILNKKNFEFGDYPNPKICTRDSNEMTYYLDKKYYNAWYDDNVGSFLIVIERKKDK